MMMIEAIREHQFVGNAHSDSGIFAAIHEFAMDESKPVAHRAEALWIMGDRGMGLTVQEFDPDLPPDWKPGVHANFDRETVERYMADWRDADLIADVEDSEGGTHD
jgi:hypothetical protein